MSAGDHDLARRAFRWPLTEALVAYRRRVRAEELESWRWQRLVWAAAGAGGRAPEPPEWMTGYWRTPEVIRG